MTRKRDSQRSAVYAWERAAVDHFASTLRRVISEADAQALIARIWKEQATRFGKSVRQAPTLAYRTGGGNSFYSPTKHAIRLLPEHRNIWIALHECAHALDWSRGCEWHGPRFVAVYMYLLTVYGGASNEQLRDSAARHGLRVYDRFHVDARPADMILHHLPGTVIEIAVAAGVSWRVVQGALIGPVRRGEVIRRGKVYRAAQ